MNDLSKILFSVLFLCLFFCSCNDNETFEPDLQFEEVVHTRSRDNTKSRVNPKDLDKSIKMTNNYLNNYLAVNPHFYFGQDLMDYYSIKIAENKSTIEKIGFENFLQQMVDNETFTLDTKQLVYESSIYKEDIDNLIATKSLVSSFERDFKKPCLEDPIYCYMYNLILNYYNQIQAGDIAQVRTGCSWEGFFETIAAGFDIGFQVGSLDDQDGNFILLFTGFTGGVIGGAIGAIIGLFTWNVGCQDCGPVTSYSFTNVGACSQTRTIMANGAGPDVVIYNWDVTQGSSNTLLFSTTVNTFEVTQINSDEPLTVGVVAICEEGPQDRHSDVIDLNVNSDDNPLGDVGDVIISYGCAVDQNTGGADPYSCSMTGEFNNVHWVSTNQGSGNINYQYVITPSSMAEVIEVDKNNIDIYWINTGDATLSVIATNICTNETVTETKSIFVPI